MKRFVGELERSLLVIAPSERDWAESGRIVSQLAAAHGYDVHKTREIHFDVLIALTARRIGAVLITCNASDFSAIREHLNFKLVCW
jgi:predicted nucleic acid-binding protein